MATAPKWVRLSQGGTSFNSLNASSHPNAFNAFFMSEFDFWDARILADYWNLSIRNSKLNIGRKLIRNQQNGTLDFAINSLNSQVRRAREQYLRSVRYNPSTYALYLEYYTYNDAKHLAQLWNNGNASPQQIAEAKYAIDQAWLWAITTSSKHP